MLQRSGLSERFENDGKSSLRLNELQHRTKKQIEEKIEKGIYSFEEVPCCVCGGKDFDILSEKDRYGLYHPVVICRDCGLVQTNPRMTQESYNQFYQTDYRKLYVGKEVPTSEFFKSQYEHGGDIYKYLTENLEIEIRGLFIVEIGCAAGGILQYFREKGNDAYGVDLDPQYIEFGRANYGLNIEVGTIDKVVKLDKTPDIVIYSHVLEHILDPVTELLKLREIMGQQSFVYIELPGIKNLTRSYQADFLRLLQNAHVYYPTLASLRNILRKASYDFVCGDEVIHSVFRRSSLATTRVPSYYDSDYQTTIAFLQHLERTRLFPTPYKIKAHCKGHFTKMLIQALKALGLYNLARSFYARIR